MSQRHSIRNGKASNNSVRPKKKRQRRQPQNPCVVVTTAGDDHRIEPDDLLDDDLVADLHRRIDADQGTIRFRIQNLLSWPDDARFVLLSLIAGSERPYEVSLPGYDSPYTDVFQAVLATLRGGNDVARCERGRRAALEAAALVHSDALEIACSQVATRLKELGIKGILPQSLLKTARGLAGQQDDDVELTPLTCADAFLEFARERLSRDDDSLVVVYYREFFWRWDGKRWIETPDEAFKSAVIEFLQGLVGSDGIGDSFVRDVLTHLKGRTRVDRWDDSPPLWITSTNPIEVERSHYLAFQNGLVDMRDLLSDKPLQKIAVDAHDPRHFSSIVLPFDFDPTTECRLWKQTLREILPRKNKKDNRIKVLREFMGWSLMPGDMTFQKFLVLVGDGGNGKSTLLRVWEQLLGADNVSHVPLEQLNGEFRVEQMNEKLANIAGDMSYVGRVAEGRLKEFTGGDPVQINRKYKSPITMVPSAVLIFATNRLPPINDRTDGFWRRLIALPFFAKFSGNNRDRRRAERLFEEMPSIFNWAIVGARRLLQQQRFTHCAICRRCREEHRDHSDPFRQWFNDRAIVDAESSVPVSNAYEDYRDFCERNGRKPVNSSEFGKRVLERPGVVKRRRGPRQSREAFYVGICLRYGCNR